MRKQKSSKRGKGEGKQRRRGDEEKKKKRKEKREKKRSENKPNGYGKEWMDEYKRRRKWESAGAAGWHVSTDRGRFYDHAMISIVHTIRRSAHPSF